MTDSSGFLFTSERGRSQGLSLKVTELINLACTDLCREVLGFENLLKDSKQGKLLG